MSTVPSRPPRRQRSDLPAVEAAGKRCQFPVIDADLRARVCGKPATSTRAVDGVDLDVCDRCATCIDAQGRDPKARRGEPPPFDMVAHEADVRRRWDAEQAKLPPEQRRTLDEAEADEEAHMGRAL